jgi:5-methylcytosine-specific restriction endonuclease McrA
MNKQEYAAYLKTKHWRDYARKKIFQARYRCQLCNSEGELHVHHRTYERVGRERYRDTIVLCKRCHEHFHGILLEPSKEREKVSAATSFTPGDAA